MLGRGVVRHGRHADQPLYGTDEDNGSAFIPFDHVRNHRFDGFPRSRQVDVDNFLPGLFGEFPCKSVAGYSSIRAYDVYMAEIGYRLIDDGLQLLEVARIRLACDDPPAQ